MNHQTNHPFFSKQQSEMSQRALMYKSKMDNFHNLSKKEQNKIGIELISLGFYWPNPLRQEGFWCTKEEEKSPLKDFPYPQENILPQGEKKDFLAKLDTVEKKSRTMSYMGNSKCRICGKTNGTKTYYSDLFAWPEGYRHYIEDHGVMPSAAFVLHIRGLI